MAHPTIGNKAPTFSLHNQRGEQVNLNDYAGKKCGDLFLSKGHDTGLHHSSLRYSR